MRTPQFILLLGAAAGWICLAQQSPLARVSVRSVAVDVSVTLNQRPLTDLQPSDFELTEQGQRRQITAVDTADRPLDIVLVTPLEPASSIMVLAATILKQIRPQDRVAIVSHGLDPAIELPFTSDRNRIAAAIRGLGGRREAADPLVRTESIAIEYAIRLHADAAQASLPARNARRLVVKLVRPMSYLGSLAHFDDRYGGRLILRLWEADIPLTSVCVPCAGWAPSFIPPEFQTLAARVGDRRQVSQTMDHIARASGGAVVSSSDPKDAEDILTHLRQRYVLWFDQPEGISPGQERKISVELSSEARKRYPDAVVHARQGYVTR